MQVAQHNDHVTHAVISGHKSIEFGISSSAEFFNILSSSLYKDQILAVVRETLCNAWDAHIEAGCTDRPVLVTLEGDKFTIRDFGKGIHHDDMGLIYGTYGNSTKKNDGTQTGGFGLGCKAPFAYTDHFEVTSCHGGVRTIYTLSKSSAQAMGKPGITPIASFPTTETGLTVSIRVNQKDVSRFKELIMRIAHNGDMNVQLNGTQVNTLNFDITKHNFVVVAKNLLDLGSRVMVRYGNVIYPVEEGKSNSAYESIVRHLTTLSTWRKTYSIVFQAPPHSIAVTPSRETLSMQAHTQETLDKLFNDFLASLDTEFSVACQQYQEEVIQSAVAAKRVDELLKTEESLPFTDEFESGQAITDFNEMAKTYLRNNYKSDLSYRKADITRRLELMVKANLLDRGKVSTFLRDLKRIKTPASQWSRSIYEKTTWLQRQVLAPLVTKLAQAGLPHTTLYTCDSENHNWQGSNRVGVAPLVPATQSNPRHLLRTLPFLRNIVVLSSRRQGLMEEAYSHSVFKEAGQYYGFLVYIVGRKKGELEAARQFFATTGMRVVDLTLEDEEEARPVRAKPDTPRKPAKKGVVKLSSVQSRTGINLQNLLEEDAERIENPEFILKVSLRQQVSCTAFYPWNSQISRLLVEIFGDKGGITNNSSRYEKCLAKGAVPFEEYVRNKICEYVLHNPRIETYWAHNPNTMGWYGDHRMLINLIFQNEILAKEFGVVSTLTELDKQYLSLWGGINEHTSVYFPDPEVTKVRDWRVSIPTAPAIEDLTRKLKSPLLPLLHTSELGKLLEYGSSTEVSQAVALLKTILNT